MYQGCIQFYRLLKLIHVSFSLPLLLYSMYILWDFIKETGYTKLLHSTELARSRDSFNHIKEEYIGQPALPSYKTVYVFLDLVWKRLCKCYIQITQTILENDEVCHFLETI